MNFTNEENELLKSASAATQSNSFVYAPAAASATLVAQGLLEINPAVVDAQGGVAHRATTNGIAYAATLVAPVVAAAPAASNSNVPALAHPGFAVGAGFVAPAKAARKAGGARTYPFENLELNGWIFVPATEKRPDPKKSLASTISSANKRFKEFSPRRYFKTFRAVQGQQFGSMIAPSNGAYIVRIEPPAAGTPEAAE